MKQEEYLIEQEQKIIEDIKYYKLKIVKLKLKAQAMGIKINEEKQKWNKQNQTA